MGQSLRWALEEAHIPVLIAVLAHVTGEDSWLQDPYRPASSPGLHDDPGGGLPEEVQQRVRHAALEVLSGSSRTVASPEHWQRIRHADLGAYRVLSHQSSTAGHGEAARLSG